MIVKLKDIIKANATITIILNTKMRAASAFKFRKLLAVLNNNLDLFNETKQGIISKYNLESKEDGNLIIPEDISDEVNTEFTELLEQDITIENLSIKIDDFRMVDLSPTQVEDVYWLLDS